jgi:hypothetical protein
MEENKPNNVPANDPNNLYNLNLQNIQESMPNSSEPTIFSWSAPEFIEHHKTVKWFVALALIFIVIIAGVFLLTKSVFPVIMLALIGLIFGIIAARKPRIIEYFISLHGVKLGNRFVSYSEFKSFNAVRQFNLGSIILNPLKRFMPPVTINYDLSIEDKVIALISDYLPMTAPSDDPVEILMRKIRF